MRPAIIETIMSQLVEEGRDLLQQLNMSEHAAAVRRMMFGRFLNKARGLLPKRGSASEGWGAFLEAIELDQATAQRYMVYAEQTLSLTERDKLPTYADVGLDKRVGPEPPEAPTPTDDDAPAEETKVQADESVDVDLGDNEPEPLTLVQPANRDAWCTPEWLTAALPHVDLDPCSNERSTVRALATYCLERGENGLVRPWHGLVYVNGPYSDLLPWAAKLDQERQSVVGAGFLVNADHSPAWWKLLAKHLWLRLDFDERLEFVPPPGVKPSKNDRPQTLLMDATFWAACEQEALLLRGTLWELKNWHE